MSAIAQAAEYRDIRLKSGEKTLYKHVNKDVGIKFPIKVDIALSAHKVSLLLQAELGGLDFPIGEQFAKHKNQFQQDKAMVFQHVNRLIRCVIDCQLTRGDSVSSRHALELARSFAARVWDNSPLQLKQLDQIGNVAVRKLANAGINSIESLENTESHRIETVIGRGPPFGMKLLSKVAQFPKLRVSVEMVGKEMKQQGCIKIKLKAEVGFLNHNVPTSFRKKPVYICFLAETSDGQIIDFRRIAASKLQNGHEVLLPVELTKPSQYVSCHVMCDEVAGTCRSAELRPNLPASSFPTLAQPARIEKKDGIPCTSLSRGQSQDSGRKRKKSEDFDDCGLDDGDLLAAEAAEIIDIDTFDDELAALPSKKHASSNKRIGTTMKQRTEVDRCAPTQLKNEKWPCNHKCRDKAKCKHLCCKEGLDNPPKPSKKASSGTTEEHPSVASMLDVLNRNSSVQPTPTSTNDETESKKPLLNHGAPKQQNSLPGVKKAARLDTLRQATSPVVGGRSLKPAKSNLATGSVIAKQSFAATRAYSRGNANESPFTENRSDWGSNIVSNDLEEFANPKNSFRGKLGMTAAVRANQDANSDSLWPDVDNDDFTFDDNDDLMLEASLVGLEDSMQLKKDGPSSQIDKNYSGSNGSYLSGTLRESNFSRAERSPADDIFHCDDGIHDFAREDPDVIDLTPDRSSNTGAGKHVSGSSSNHELTNSPSKKLFFTSPERVQVAPTNACDKDRVSQQKKDVEISTTVENVRALPGKTSNSLAADSKYNRCNHPACGEPVEYANDATREKESEEEQNLLMDGIDPSFYDEFKDFVEFI
jgi:Sec63 Brl domain